MTAKDEMRRLLDELGVEYTVVHGYQEYIWEFGESGIARASRIGTKGLVQMIVTGITPEQAIAVTLGSCSDSCNCTNSERMGTCEQEEGGWSTEGDHARVWLTCGHDCMVETVADLPNFCPVCGAKVVDE